MWCNAVGFIVTLSLCMLAVPLAAVAQPAGKVPKIGFLHHSSANSQREAWTFEAFQQVCVSWATSGVQQATWSSGNGQQRPGHSLGHRRRRGGCQAGESAAAWSFPSSTHSLPPCGIRGGAPSLTAPRCGQSMRIFLRVDA
jgi:hypothetical protein